MSAIVAEAGTGRTTKRCIGKYAALLLIFFFEASKKLFHRLTWLIGSTTRSAKAMEIDEHANGNAHEEEVNTTARTYP
jgi:hypothetical protein